MGVGVATTTTGHNIKRTRQGQANNKVYVYCKNVEHAFRYVKDVRTNKSS